MPSGREEAGEAGWFEVHGERKIGSMETTIPNCRIKRGGATNVRNTVIHKPDFLFILNFAGAIQLIFFTCIPNY